MFRRILRASVARLRLCTARREESADSFGKAFDLLTRMAAVASAMQALDDFGRGEALPGQREGIAGARLRGFGSAAHPEHVGKVDSGSGSREWIEGIRCIDPCAEFVLCEPRQKRKRDAGATGALRPAKLADGSDGQAAVECSIERGNARGGDWADEACRGRERRGYLMSKRRLDLQPEGGGGRHGNLFALCSPMGVGGCQSPFALRKVQSEFKPLI